MEQPVRSLNEEGIQRFRQYLGALREDGKGRAPRDILFDPHFSSELAETALIEEKDFKTRMEAMVYLSPALSPVEGSLIEDFEGVWSWLSLFYFDQLCPDEAGRRNPGKDFRLIPDTGYSYRHRHLLEAPYRIYQKYGENAHLLLDTPLHIENHFHLQIASRPSFINNPSIIDAATRLYFDRKHGHPKPGSQSPEKAGGLIRFVDVIEQLNLTYDLYSLDADKIIALLPKEFQVWRR